MTHNTLHTHRHISLEMVEVLNAIKAQNATLIANTALLQSTIDALTQKLGMLVE